MITENSRGFGIRKMKENLKYIDQAKGIGIIAVVMLHSGLMNQPMIACISAFIMPLFFITSGMLLNHTGVITKKTKAFYWGRTKSFLVPYVVFGLLYLLMGAVRGYTTPALFGMFFENITLFGNSVLWFLPCLFMAQAVIYEVYRRIEKKKAFIIVLIVGALGYMGMKQLIVAFPKETLFWQGLYYVLFSVGRAMFAAAFVALGYQLLDVLEKPYEKKVQVLVGIVFLFIWIVCAEYNGVTDFKLMAFGRLWSYLVAAIAATIGILLICKSLSKDKLFAFCGRHSLIIMLTHLDLQYLNIAIKCGELLQKYTGSLGTVCFWLGTICSMILLEIITIYICNRYFCRKVRKAVC